MLHNKHLHKKGYSKKHKFWKREELESLCKSKYEKCKKQCLIETMSNVKKQSECRRS